MLRKFCLIIPLLVSISCQKSLPDLKDFDSAAWKNDPLGCLNEREKLLNQLEKNKEKFIGLGQNQVLSILGKPDIQNLYQRNQRFYVYFYQKGRQCEEDIYDLDIRNAEVVQIRFSALDAVTEVVIN